MSTLLYRLGFTEFMDWETSCPAYHIEIAISGAEREASSVWDADKLTRVG
jgi:hypothetical protein